jgi:hypothetical protein
MPMYRRWSIAVAALLACGWLAPGAGRAEEAPVSAGDGSATAQSDTAAGDPFADTELFEPEAISALRDMVVALQGAEKLSVLVDEEHDALQPSGETFSFGKSAELTVRRPDRMRVVGSERGGGLRNWSYDGSRLTVYDPERNLFASVERSGSLDSVFTFLRDDVGMKLSLAPLFSEHLGQLLLENMTTATYVGEEELDGVDCRHVAFRYGEGVGFQVWLPLSGSALPRRLIMTFEDARGRPQFRADFRKWDESPDVPDELFTFRAPPGARSVPFVLPARADASAVDEGSR